MILLKQPLRKVSDKDKTFEVESPETNSFKAEYLNKYAEQNQISAVIHGHTHSAKSYTVGNGELLYLNSGTWGRLLRLPQKQDSDEDWKTFLAKLEAGVDESFNRLTFLRIIQDNDIKATLNEWKQENQIEELSVKHLAPISNTWSSGK